MNNSVFGNILLKKREDGKENNSYYERAFENWATTRISEFTTSNQFGRRTKWMQTFINLYCEHLIEITIKIASGAHLKFKNKPKWDAKYTGGFLDLFHFLDYGSGYSNTIETILMTLKLNWDEDPVLARNMQTYCIDRISELKRFIEVNYFIKKGNPIFIWYNEIITRFQNIIDFPETELRANQKNTIHVLPTPSTQKKDRILELISSLLFFQIQTSIGGTNEILTLENWENKKNIFFKQRSEGSNASYTPKEKIKYELNAIEKLSVNDSDHEFLKDRYKNYLLELLEDLEEKNIKIVTEDNQNNPYPEIFTDYQAYTLFLKLFNDYRESKTQLADFSFVYRKMYSDKFIKDYFKPEMFKEWISKEPFCIILDNGLKTLDRCQTDNKKRNYDTAKTIRS